MLHLHGDNVMLEIKQLVKTFKNTNGEPIFALNGLNLSVSAGEFLVMMGPNGSGKSTLLRILAGEQKPDCGQVEFTKLCRENSRNCIHQVPVGYVPQDPKALSFLDMTLEEHMLYAELAGQRAHFWRRGITRTRSARYSELLQNYEVNLLVDSLDRPLKTLSGGWQQIFVILLAVVGPLLRGEKCHSLLLLDEPMASLDMKNTNLFLDIVKQIHEQGHTIILATHDLDVAINFAQRVCLLNNGVLVDDISTKTLKEKSNNEIRLTISNALNHVGSLGIITHGQLQ
jgi:putative tryptophan/tyrosine transport system ATP-binding protein